MDLRQLRYALAVVDEGTFTAAAAACFVAQPSLSQAVASLERELGVALFDDSAGASSLTAAGMAFVPAAREALRAVSTIVAEVGAVVGLIAGHLDLVALPTLAVDPVTPLVGAFRRAHPGVVVRLAHPDDTGELLARVRSGVSEVGITELPVRAERIVSRDLLRQELVAVLPPGSPAPARLPGSRAGGPADGHDAGRHVDARRLGRRPRPVGRRLTTAVETEQREAIGPLVLAGAGVAVLPRPMADVVAAQGAVVVALDPPLWRRIGIVHRDAPLSPAARAFLEPRVTCSVSPHKSPGDLGGESVQELWAAASERRACKGVGRGSGRVWVSAPAGSSALGWLFRRSEVGSQPRRGRGGPLRPVSAGRTCSGCATSEPGALGDLARFPRRLSSANAPRPDPSTVTRPNRPPVR